MPEILLDGEVLHYRQHRDALQPPVLPLVLVHGAGGNLMHWPGELRRLPNETVYALDMPGHGRSRGRARQDIGAYAEVVQEFTAALGVSEFVLAGHSMGGAIALECALRQPARLAGLILVGSGARLPVDPQILTSLRYNDPAVAALLTSWALGEQVDPRTARIHLQRLREVNPDVFYADLLACERFDRTADLDRISVPTLVICGEADRMTPVEHSRYVAERIAGAQLITVPGAGHMVMLERPDIVCAAISVFLRERVRPRDGHLRPLLTPLPPASPATTVPPREPRALDG